MAVRRIFELQNAYQQGAGRDGICTVASLQWAKRTLQLGRGLGNAGEMLLDDHQLNALMAVYRQMDGDPAGQTEGMGLRPVGNDHAIASIVDMQLIVNATLPNICIFWNATHTMGYRVQTRQVGRFDGAMRNQRECEFFDNENGLWLSGNQRELAVHMADIFANNGYAAIQGMRVVQL